MFCPNCGCPNPDEYQFCSQCGAPLIDNQPTAQAKPAYQALAFFRKHRKKILRISAIVIVVLAVFFGAKAALNAVFSPKATVRRYIEALQDQDWDQVYSLLSLPDSPFLTVEQLQAAMQADPMVIDQYQIQESGSSDLAQAYYGSSSGSETGLTRSYTVYYVSPGATSQSEFSVQLIRQGRNRLLFFPSYRVSPTNLLTPFSVAAPDSMAVTLDGIALEPYSSSDGTSYYSIDALFVGTHQLSAESPILVGYDETMDVWDDPNYSIPDIGLNEETAQALMDQTKNLLSAYWDSLTAGAPFDALQLPCPVTDDCLSSLQDDYESTQFYSCRGEDGSLLSHQATDFINIQTEPDYYNSGCYQLYFEYQYLCETKNGTSSVSDTYQSSASCQYRYEDGVFTLCGIDSSLFSY